MRLVGPVFLERFPGQVINTHPALSPAFPGMHGPRDALAYGVKITGCTIFVVDAGVDTGPIVAQVAVPVLDDDDEFEPARTHQGARARAPRADGGRPGHRHVPHRGKKGRAHVTQRPIRRALVSVYDKTGLAELAQGLHEAGVSLVSTGSTAARIADAGVPVTKVEDLTGFPECLDGRVKTLHPRVHAGILADRRKPDHERQLADLGIEAVRPGRRQPLPVHPDRGVGGLPRRVRRADRHRRSVDGAGGGQEPPQRRRRRVARALPRACSTPCALAASPWSSGSDWRRTPSCTPPPTTSPSPRG